MLLRHQHPQSVRRGFAPFEAVLAVPFLLLMTAFMFKIAEAGLIKARVNGQSRRDAWAKRGPKGQTETDPKPPGNLAALRTASDDSRGLSRVEANRDMSIGLMGLGNRTVRGAHAVLGDPWDHQSVAFESRGYFDFDRRIMKVAANLPTSLDAFKNPANVVGGGAGNLLEALAKMAIADTALGKALDVVDKLKKAKEKAEKGGIGGFLEGLGEALGIINPSEYKKIIDGVSKAKGLIKDINKMLDLMKGEAPF